MTDTCSPATKALRTLPRRLARAKSGVAMIEFAFSMPLVLMIGLYGLESANMALINLRVSQIALTLADNSSRVGLMDSNQIEQLREVDLNDVLEAARAQGSTIDLTNNGRITVSSLETDDKGVQRIHWQRCIGKKSGTNYDSSYGTTTITAGTDTTPANAGTLAPTGMGDPGQKVNAPSKGGVMFVEINYDYKPIVGQWLFGAARIHYVASFIVRDNRDFTQIYNPVTTPATPRATCNLYPA